MIKELCCSGDPGMLGVPGISATSSCAETFLLWVSCGSLRLQQWWCDLRWSYLVWKNMDSNPPTLPILVNGQGECLCSLCWSKAGCQQSVCAADICWCQEAKCQIIERETKQKKTHTPKEKIVRKNWSWGIWGSQRNFLWENCLICQQQYLLSVLISSLKSRTEIFQEIRLQQKILSAKRPNSSWELRMKDQNSLNRRKNSQGKGSCIL